MTPTSTEMTYAGHVRALLVLGLPIIGGHLGQTAIGATDTAMLGWYSVTALAAIGLGGSYFYIFFLMGSGFAWAAMPLVAAYAAENDEIGLRRATRMALWLSGAFALLSLPFLILSEPILRLLGQPEDVVQAAATYLRIAGWGIVPALGVMVIKSYLAALERTQPVLWIILASAVVNAAFNWALIFGNWGAPELGLRGAAIASVVTQVFTLIGVVAYAVWALPEHELFRRLWRVDQQMLGKVFGLGWPIGLTTLSEVGLFSASLFMIGWLGVIPQAAHTAVIQIASITFMLHMGLSNAATVRAGNALGRRDVTHLVRGAQTALCLSVGISILTMIAFLVIPEALISLFLDSEAPARDEILRIGVVLMAMAALFQLVDGAQVIALGVLRGVQDTRVPMIMAAISYWVLGMPASYVLGFILGWGGPGIWAGLVIGLSGAALGLLWRFWGPVLRELRLNTAQMA